MRHTELLSQALDKIGSYFLLCNLLSSRVKQLEDGAKPKVDAQSASNVELGLLEIIEDKLKISEPKEG